MKKRFEIEWDSNVSFGDTFIQKLLNACFETEKIKVTELLQPTKQCECANPTVIDCGKGWKCSYCHKIPKPQPTEYCKCPTFLSVGVLCDVCNKPFEPESKLKIDKLAKFVNDKSVEYFNREKLNEIIDRINKEVK